jgi:hypothetical protein
MQGRNILDGVVTLHETVYELHSKKLNEVILKLDFEKAYDKVKWCNIPIFGKEFKNLAHEIIPSFHAFFHLCNAQLQFEILCSFDQILLCMFRQQGKFTLSQI